MNATENSKIEATFSTLVMSLGSSALMSLGLVPDPSTGKTKVDKNIAKFNIDLLIMLKEKTKGNISEEELAALDSILSDLQMKFIQV